MSSYVFNVGWAELAKPNNPSIIKPHLLGFASSAQPTAFSLFYYNNSATTSQFTISQKFSIYFGRALR